MFMRYDLGPTERPPMEVLVVSPSTSLSGEERLALWQQRDSRPLVAVTPNLLASMAEEIVAAVDAGDDVAQRYHARQCLLALLDHLIAWPGSSSPESPPGGYLGALQDGLFDTARHLVLAMARDNLTTRPLAHHLAALAALYSERSGPGDQ